MSSTSSGSPIDPSFQFAPVTPSDTIPLSYHGSATRAKAFYVIAMGDLVIQDDRGTTVTFTNVLQGVIYPLSSNFVMAATTATVIALF